METKWKIIGRGYAGWHATAEYEPSSGYSNVTGSGASLGEYLSNASEGAFIYDADLANNEDFARFIIKAGLVDTRIPDGQMRDKFDEQGAFASIDAETYMREMYARVRGVRMGKIINHEIQWFLVFPERKPNGLKDLTDAELLAQLNVNRDAVDPLLVELLVRFEEMIKTLTEE